MTCTGGGRLETAESWLARHRQEATTDERAFVEAGVALREAERDQERRDYRRLRRLLTVVAVVAVIAIVAGALAVQQQSQANEARDDAQAQAEDAQIARGDAEDNAVLADQERRAAEQARFDAETRRLIADSARLIPTNRRVSLLLAAEAHRRDPSPETLGGLQRALIGTSSFLGYIGSGPISGVGFNHDGSLLAAQTTTGLAVYDLDTSTPTWEIPFSEQSLLTVANDGTTIVTATTTGELASYSFDGSPAGDALQLDVEVITLTASPTEPIAIVGTATGSVIAVDLEQGTVRWRDDETHTLPVDRLAIGEDGRRLASTNSRGPAIVVRDASSGEKTAVIDYPNETFSLAISATDDAVLVAGGSSVFGWDASTGTSTGIAMEINESPFAMVPIDGINRLATASGNQIVRFRNLAAGETEDFTIDAQAGSLNQLVLSPDGTTLAAAGADGISLWSMTGDGLLAATLPPEVVGNPDLLALSPDGDYLAAWFNLGPDQLYRLDGQLTPVELDTDLPNIWMESTGLMSANFDIGDPATPIPVIDIIDPTDLTIRTYETRGVPWAGDVSPDGRLLAIGRLDGHITIIDTTTGDEVVLLATLGVEQRDAPPFVNTVMFSPDGTRLISGAGFGGVDLYDVATWERIGGLDIETGAVSAMWSEDGESLLIGAFDGEITLRDPDDLATVHSTLSGHLRLAVFKGVGPVFSADANYLYSADRTGIRVWDLQTNTQLGDPFPSDGQLGVLPVTPAGLAAASQDGRIVLWNLHPSTWPNLVCQAAGRNLTVAEWGDLGPADQDPQATCPRWSPPQ